MKGKTINWNDVLSHNALANRVGDNIKSRNINIKEIETKKREGGAWGRATLKATSFLFSSVFEYKALVPIYREITWKWNEVNILIIMKIKYR